MRRVTSSKLAADGLDVAVAYAGDTGLAGATVGEIAGTGGTARHLRQTSPTSRRYRLSSGPSRTVSGAWTWSCIRPGSTVRPRRRTLTWLSSTRFTG